jgi:hypothetical protein
LSTKAAVHISTPSKATVGIIHAAIITKLDELRKGETRFPTIGGQGTIP